MYRTEQNADSFNWVLVMMKYSVSVFVCAFDSDCSCAIAGVFFASFAGLVLRNGFGRNIYIADCEINT